jgi:hypothetical protein
VTLYTESSNSFVASAAASIASTGWSEPVSGRQLRALKSSAFHGENKMNKMHIHNEDGWRQTIPGVTHSFRAPGEMNAVTMRNAAPESCQYFVSGAPKQCRVVGILQNIPVGIGLGAVSTIMR